MSTVKCDGEVRACPDDVRLSPLCHSLCVVVCSIIAGVVVVVVFGGGGDIHSSSSRR